MATAEIAQPAIVRLWTAGARAWLLRRRSDWSTWTLLVLVAGASFLHLFRLNHSSVSPWDESIHAIVAQHLIQHPLQPTLFETAALVPNPPPSWQLTHIWLHIPPFGLWAAALSMRILGETPFALRLPGALFIAAGMLVSYALGRRLFGRVAGLAGAAFVGLSPYFLLVSQGYVFGDLTDTPLLFLTPLAFYFLVMGYRTGRLRWLIGAGCATGLCYLTKAAIGILPLLVGLVALYACERLFPPERDWCPLGLRGVAAALGSAAAVAGPYILYTDLRYPVIAGQEATVWRSAIFTSYEGWGRPFDYHLTMYLYAAYGPPTALLLLASLLALGVIAWRRRSRADALVVAWIVALYLPLSLAVTKAAPMTIAAAPAWGYAVARVTRIGLTSRSRAWQSVAGGGLLGAGALGLALPWLFRGNSASAGSSVAAQLYTASLPPIPPGVPLLVRFAPLLIAAALSGLAAGVCWLTLGVIGVRSASRDAKAPLPAPRAGRGLAILTLAVAIAGVSLTWLTDDWTVVTTRRVYVAPGQAVGAMIAQHTPTNASIVLDADATVSVNANFMAMFWAHRDIYMSRDASAASLCAQSHVATGKRSPFYVLTRGPLAGVGAPIAAADGWTLYQPICAVATQRG